MKKTPLSKISKKQEVELARRRVLKYELFLKQAGRCARCNKYLSYANGVSDNFPHLSHKTPLSRGGKTTRDNCEDLCAECHSREHNLRNIYNE